MSPDIIYDNAKSTAGTDIDFKVGAVKYDKNLRQ